MMKNFTHNLKKLLVPLTVLCMLMVSAMTASYGQGRQTVFLEDFGNAAGGPVTGFGGYTNNEGLSITGTATIKADIPSDYTDASGGNNVDFLTRNTLVIAGINTDGFSTIDLAFGVYRTNGAALTVEYNTGNGTWVAVSSLAISGSTNSSWSYIASQDSPFPQSTNLSIRFTHSGNRGTLKLDDIKLTGGISQPTITNITPGKGGIGTEVTVTGYNLESVYEVYFEEAAKSAFTYGVTSTSFKFRVPEGAETSTLKFYDTAGDVPLAESTSPFEVIIPTITTFDPVTATPGTLITITGTNLGSATSVVFGGAGSAAPASAPTDTQVQVRVPATAESGRVDVITADYGIAYSTQNFTVLKPAITRINDASGTAVTSAREGATLTIIGTRLNVGGTPVVDFGGVSATVTSATETEVVVTVPAGAQSGPISLTTTESTATSANFTIIKPSITITGTPLAAFQSVENKASSVQQYNVTATNLVGGINVSAPAHFQVSTDNVNFGQTAAILQSGGNASGTIYVRYLPTAVGSHVGFIVHESSGISESVQVQGTATEAPLAITSLTPSSAKLNQTITINGTRLNIGGNPIVTFSGGATATVISASATALDVKVPTTANTGPITVTTSEGTATSGTFTVLSPVLTITQAVSPFNAVSGTTTSSQQYTVRGTNIASNLVITAPAHFQVSSNNISFSSSITLTPSAIENTNKAVYVRYRPTAVGNHSGNIVHTTEGVVESFGVTGTAVEPLSITSLSPNNGPVGTTVQINGYRLNQGGTPTVTFGGGVAATVSSATATAVIVAVPAGAQTGTISLRTSEGTVTSGVFTVTPAMFISASMQPFKSEVGDRSATQSYTMSGTNFTEAVRVSAPFNFFVSLSANGGFGTSVDIVPAADGSIPATPIYVQYYSTMPSSDAGDITNASAGVATMRVPVEGQAILPQGALPVEFVSFTYVQQKDGVLLEWKTASESNNSHFEVEMTNNLNAGFNKIGRVESKVINSAVLTKYQYKHSFTTGGTRYYRLKQVDLDGTVEYSNVIAVEVAAAEAVTLVSVAPNPINYNSKVFITALNEGKATLRLSSLEGKQVYTKEATVRQGENEIQLPVYDQLSKGVYLLTVELNGTIHKVKVLKQ